jgi:NAD(P)-dependent dehydrogenase (short-subunit alcohol dehydrogenase family)
MNWTTADIPSQRGKRALVTGANLGIGFETTLALAKAGAAVLMGGRDEAKLNRAAGEIRTRVPGAELQPVVLDLADLASIEEAAGKVVAAGRPLDLLVNNAGVMAIPERRTTRDGFELTFGTNHLGHFALAGHLLPALLLADASRVVAVSAIASRWKSGALVDLGSEERYRPMTAYAKSKFANVVFSQELNRRAQGTGLIALAVHPGSAATGLQRHGSRFTQAIASALLGRVVGQSIEQAANPSLYAATSPAMKGGEFIGPTGRGEGSGTPGNVRLPNNATDPKAGGMLWDVSEKLTRVRYEF